MPRWATMSTRLGSSGRMSRKPTTSWPSNSAAPPTMVSSTSASGAPCEIELVTRTRRWSCEVPLAQLVGESSLSFLGAIAGDDKRQHSSLSREQSALL